MSSPKGELTVFVWGHKNGLRVIHKKKYASEWGARRYASAVTSKRGIAYATIYQGDEERIAEYKLGVEKTDHKWLQMTIDNEAGAGVMTPSRKTSKKPRKKLSGVERYEANVRKAERGKVARPQHHSKYDITKEKAEEIRQRVRAESSKATKTTKPNKNARQPRRRVAMASATVERSITIPVAANPEPFVGITIDEAHAPIITAALKLLADRQQNHLDALLATSKQTQLLLVQFDDAVSS